MARPSAVVGEIGFASLTQRLQPVVPALIACPPLTLQNKFTRFISIFPLITNPMGMLAEGQCIPQSHSNGAPSAPVRLLCYTTQIS